MSIFRFKKFSVVNERSAMKVNTDGVLLGAAMTLRQDDRRFLDIGTGTGTIALMVAQRVSEMTAGSLTLKTVCIDAIDIDEPSASEAEANFKNSPWDGMLVAHNLPLDGFIATSPEGYDLIFSNPPYFEDSLTAPDARKSTARHTSEGLSYRDIFDFAAKHLSSDGRVALVLPAEQEAAVSRYARMCGLHLFRIVRVRTVPRKTPTRMIVEFSRIRSEEVEDTMLTIQNEGQYTEQYLSITKEFYLFA